MSPVPTLGVLAGMGPRSTAPFVDLLVTECRRQYGARYDDEFPPIMVYSVPTPLRLDRPLDEPALRDAIRAALVRLVGTGVDLVAMPCNTAHIFHRELAAAIPVPLLDMVELGIDAVPSDAHRVAPLATSFTLRSGLYQERLGARGFDVVDDAETEAEVHRIIETVKSVTDPRPARRLWRQLLGRLEAEDVDTVLLACTDLNPARSEEELGPRVLDVTALLAAAAIHHWRALAPSTGSRADDA